MQPQNQPHSIGNYTPHGGYPQQPSPHPLQQQFGQIGRSNKGDYGYNSGGYQSGSGSKKGSSKGGYYPGR